MDHQLEMQLSVSPLAAAEARGFLRAALPTWALDGFGQITELLASELVTNAVQHGESPVMLSVGTDPAVIRVEVADQGRAQAVLLRVDDETEHGRGLFLISELASRWGSQRGRGGGKSVWFEIDATD